MTNIQNLVRTANAALMQLADPGESMLELADRIRNDINSSDDAIQRLNVAIAMQSSYEYAVREFNREVQTFREQTVLGDQARLKRAYDDDFDVAVVQMQEARDIPWDEAVELVEQLIMATSIAAVLPECGRIENAIRARSIVAYSL